MRSPPGRNSVGQAGDGTTTQRKTPVQVSGLSDIVQVATRDDHSLALASDGAIFVWHRNTNGQLGDNTTTFRSTLLALASRGSEWVLAAPGITPASGSYGARKP